jgi:hypothetical protein
MESRDHVAAPAASDRRDGQRGHRQGRDQYPDSLDAARGVMKSDV